ncbi:MAG: GSCFA domain-containing protein [Actinobacteria bacterium]|nr:GSCFA domain-containing protein [Actinomycetota bacterium]
MFPFKQNLRNKNKENNEFFLNYIKNFYSNKSLNITKNSKVSSIGSCFAREIKNYLIKKKYNYIQEEINTPRSIHSSCAWERVYNTFTLKKIFEYSFVNNFQMKYVVAKNNIVQEVTRTLTEYHSIEEAKQDFKKHAKISKNILMKSDIIIITLGLIEI